MRTQIGLQELSLNWKLSGTYIVVILLNFENLWFDHNLILKLEFTYAFITSAFQSVLNRHRATETKRTRSLNFTITRKIIVPDFLLSSLFWNLIRRFFYKLVVKASNKCFIQIHIFIYDLTFGFTLIVYLFKSFSSIRYITWLKSIASQPVLPCFIGCVLSCEKFVHHISFCYSLFFSICSLQ